MRTRTFLLALAALSLSALGALPLAQAQSAPYPNRTVRIIVPFPPGGPVDITARTLAARLSQLWNQSVVVENRSGANSAIGADAAAKAPPDGYTLFMGAIHQTVLPGLGVKLPYDLGKDFQPVMFAAAFPIVLVVNPSVPANNLPDLLRLLKAKPGKFTYGSSGNGGGTHLAGELFKWQAESFILHIPYRGSAPAMADLLGGQVDMMFADGPSALPQIKAGKVKPIAVGSAARSALVPEIPTMREGGLKNYDAYSWAGLWAQAAVPADIIAKINADSQKAFSDPAVKARLLAQGAEVNPGTPAQFGQHVAAELRKWSAVIQRAGIKPDL